MNRKVSLTFAALLLSATAAYSQGKMDPRTVLFSNLFPVLTPQADQAPDSLRIARAKIGAMVPGRASSQLAEVLLTLSREMDEEELLALGIVDPVVTGTVAVGSVNPALLPEIEKSEDILSISLSGKGRLHCDMARADTGVDIIREGASGLPQGYDGKGVITAIFDQGIEPGHINFLSPDRTESRVRRIWHYNTEQNAMGGTSTTETTYMTPEEIAELSTDDDMITHGTHTLGVMAGSFGVNKEDPEHDYSGMAPASDILIGCGSLYYSNVIRAIKRFKEYASEEKQPMVVNLSFGDNIGPHDGTDAFPKALDALAEEIPVFMSAGNEGKLNIALNKRFTESDNQVRTVISSRNTIKTYLGVTWEAACEVQIWSEDETPFTVETGLWDKSEGEWVFLLPTAADGEAAYIANGAYSSISNYENEDFDYLYQDSAIGISTGLDPSNHRYTADIWYMLNKLTNHIDRNIVPVLIVTGQPGQRVDIYSDGDYNDFGAGRMEGWDSGSPDGTISNIACGQNTIAVGSYCTRSLTPEGVEGEVSVFSSWGILPDGRSLPDILAPGECLASSMSTPFTATDYYSEQVNPAVYGIMYGEGNPFYWTVMSGTSQSSPAMAGIAALWLQANPLLTPAEIRMIAEETARPLEEMTPKCGAGKVDALEGLKKALALAASVKELSGSASPLLLTCEGGEWRVENAAGEELRVELFNMEGMRLMERVSPDGSPVRIDAGVAAPGTVTLLRATSPSGAISRKIVL